MRFLMRLLDLFSTARDKAEVEHQRSQRRTVDGRIRKLEKATLNGDDRWMLDLVRRDPSCALRIIKECDKNGPKN